jgi:hypothetical protein
MRLTLTVLLAVVWLYSRATGYTLGGRTDLLAVLALVIALFGGLKRSRTAQPERGFRPRMSR